MIEANLAKGLRKGIGALMTIFIEALFSELSITFKIVFFSHCSK